MSLLAVCLSLLCLAVGSHAQENSERGLPHVSPCPAIYSYGWGPAGGWHGIITILPPARFSEVQLVLRMTVPYYRPEAGVGRVEVKGGTPEIQAISRRAFRGERHKIQFMIVFPPFDDVPRVKEIFFNGKSFCAANQVYADTRSTIELKYTLRSGLNIPLANGNAFSVVSAEPSRPDLVTVAILRPMDEARPMVSSPQSPSRPMPPAAPRPGAQSPTGPKQPCNCNKTQDIYDEADVPMEHRPVNHVFHSFKPPRPGVEDEGPQYEDDVISGSGNNGGNNFATPPPTSANRPPPGNGNNPNRPSAGSNNNNNNASPPSGFANRPPPAYGGNNNNNASPPSGFPNRPPPANGNNNNASPPSGFPNRPPPANGNNPSRPSAGGGNKYDPSSPTSVDRPPPANGNNKEVDDKIYFIMTDSDEANSPRIVKLLEHLLVISKKHYQVDLERLQLEKKRLSLEKYPHYTFVV